MFRCRQLVRSVSGRNTALLLIVALAIGIRFLPYKACFQDGGGLHFYGGDAYYHLRRLQLLVEGGSISPSIDYYLGFPEGTVAPFPPLFYLLAALPVWILGFLSSSSHLYEFVAAALPPLWAGGSVVAVYLLGNQLFGSLSGLVAAFTMAVLPACLDQTLVGQFDNNAIEPLLAALFLFVVTKALPEPKGFRVESQEISALTRRLSYCVLAGAFAWVFLFTWRGATLFFVCLVAFAFLDFLIALKFNRNPRDVCLLVGGTVLVLAIATLPFVVFGAWSAQPAFSFRAISWLHVLVFAAGGVVLLMFGFGAGRIGQRESGRLLMSALAVLVAGIGGGAILVFSQDQLSRLTLVQYLWGGDTLWGISELSGFFGEDGAFLWRKAASFFAWTVPLLPFLWIGLLVRECGRKLSSPRHNFFLVWSLALLVLVLGRVRFAPLAALSVALLLGFVVEAFGSLGDRWRLYKVRWGGVLPLTVVGVLLFPVAGRLAVLPSTSFEYPVSKDLFAALEWIRNETPDDAGYFRPWEKPSYGVLAQWDFGYWINYLAQRPAVATNMSMETYGMLPLARFLLGDDFSEVEKVLVENKVRYVVVTHALRSLPRFAGILGLPAGDFFREVKMSSGQTMDVPGPAWGNLVSTKLLLNDGFPVPFFVDGLRQDPLHLRLVYESPGRLDMRIPNFNKPVAKVKVFEYVPGVVLSGHAAPFSKVRAEVRLRSNQGRTFVWHSEGCADSMGTYEIISPYSSESKQGAVEAMGPVLVMVDAAKNVIPVRVSEEMVLSGQVLTLP